MIDPMTAVAAASVLSSALNNMGNQQNAASTRNLNNYQFNKQMKFNAEEAQKNRIWNSPQHLMSMYKEAGLNSNLVTGLSTGIVNNAASSAGVPDNPTAFNQPLDFSGFAAAKQLELHERQISANEKVADAEARKLNADADESGRRNDDYYQSIIGLNNALIGKTDAEKVEIFKRADKIEHEISVLDETVKKLKAETRLANAQRINVGIKNQTEDELRRSAIALNKSLINKYGKEAALTAKQLEILTQTAISIINRVNNEYMIDFEGGAYTVPGTTETIDIPGRKSLEIQGLYYDVRTNKFNFEFLEDYKEAGFYIEHLEELLNIYNQNLLYRRLHQGYDTWEWEYGPGGKKQGPVKGKHSKKEFHRSKWYIPKVSPIKA